MAGGWKLKRMHKLLVLSSVYRQSSEHPQNEAFSERDDLNQWWWRAERRRLEAEALRDSMLRVSGDLNLAIGGPSFFPRVGHEALVGLSGRINFVQTAALSSHSGAYFIPFMVVLYPFNRLYLI